MTSHPKRCAPKWQKGKFISFQKFDAAARNIAESLLKSVFPEGGRQSREFSTWNACERRQQAGSALRNPQ